MLYRCSYMGGNLPPEKRCGQRRALKKPIEQYARRPRCLACGRDSLWLDAYQTTRNRRLTCKCAGVPYPHNRGTIVGCEHYDGFVSEEEYRDYIDKLQKGMK